MSELIEEFKNDHSEIVKTFIEVKELGIITKEGQAKFMSLVEVLLKHICTEDELLYPVLKKASENNRKLKGLLSLFNSDLENIYEDTLKFSTKYSKGIIDSNFQENYERLFETLNLRMLYEESMFFEEYILLNQQ